MTTPKNSGMTTFGRIYATGEEGSAWLGENLEALKTSQALALEGIQKGLVKPSLTTVLKWSRILVQSNTTLTPEEKATQIKYLEATKMAEKVLKASHSWESTPLVKPMQTGTAVHYAAELLNEEIRASDSGYFNTEAIRYAAWKDLEFSLAQDDYHAFECYMDALFSYRFTNLEVFKSEVTLEAEKWMGTADALGLCEVLDWKTARKPSITTNLLQVVALMGEAKKKKGVLVFLRQAGDFTTFEVEVGSELHTWASELVEAAVRLFYTRLEEETRVEPVKPSKSLLTTFGKKQRTGMAGIPAKHADITPPPF